MKNFKKVVTVGAVVFAMGVTSVAGFAASVYKTPAEAAAGLTEQTVESVIAQRQESDKSYGAIAAEAGKLDEFKKEIIEIKKANLKTQVEEKRITQEKADEIIKAIEENGANCDGTNPQRMGKEEGLRFGSNGLGQGLGNGARDGQGKGQGQGQRRGQNNGQGRIR